MKLTESMLRKIIKEELKKVLNEEKTPRDIINHFLDDIDKMASWKHIRQSFVDAAKGGTNINYPNWQRQDFQDVIDVLDNKPENKDKIQGIYKRLGMTPR